MLWRSASALALYMGSCGLLLGQTAAAGPDPLIRTALEQNRDLQAARQRVAEARGLLRQAGVRPVPTVEANVASGRPLGTRGEEEYSVGFQQPVEMGGKRSKRLIAAEAGVAFAEAEVAERERQLAFEVRSRYIDLAAAQRRLAALERIAAVNGDAYRLLDARVQRDDAAPLERQLLLVELNRTEAQKASAAGTLASARLSLQQTLGTPVSLDDAAILPDQLRPMPTEERSDLRLARALETLSSAEITLTEAQSRPDVTLSTQYARRSSQFEDPLRNGAPLQDLANIVSVGVSIPLQSRRRNLGSIEASVARQRAASLRRQHLEVTIPMEVAAARERYEAARNAARVLQRDVLEVSRRNLEVIRKAYEFGQLRLLDVLNEQRRLIETEMNAIDAEADVARSAAELDRATGGTL